MAEEFEFEEEQRDDSFDFEDEFDRLRQKTTRTSAVYDEMEFEELEEEGGEGFFAQISPQQRLILALLLLLDIIVVAIGALAVVGVI